METTVINGMCRCCASEGAFKDIKNTYHWMGDEEIYADMLRYCFDISLETSEQDDGGICEVCITQLRNATNFKKQVLHTEQQFKKHIQNKTLFKPSIVKVELPADDLNDSDDNNDHDADDSFSVTEFEVPIKTESADEAKPKKRTAKATTSRAKKSKSDNGESSTKRLVHTTTQAAKLLSGLKDLPAALSKESIEEISKIKDETSLNRQFTKVKDEIHKHRINIKEILLSTNATPIRKHATGYACCFCDDEFPEPADLKSHTLEKHNDDAKKKFMMNKPLNEYLVKLDITNLNCNLCKQNIDTLEDLIDHLKEVHAKRMYTDIKNHILPFKFDGPLLKCVVCDRIFAKYKVLQEHMCTHYNNYICDLCDAGFVNFATLRHHSQWHEIGSYKCSYCPKSFDNLRKKKSHETCIHLQLLHKCKFCKEKFRNYDNKRIHMAREHGFQAPKIQCQACPKSFRKQSMLTYHIRKHHLLEKRFKCSECDKEYFDEWTLKEHMNSHTGDKKFVCHICWKSYGRKYTLREHMRIHEDDRRFKCEYCDYAFVQKCSWKSHMRTRHGEDV